MRASFHQMFSFAGRMISQKHERKKWQLWEVLSKQRKKQIAPSKTCFIVDSLFRRLPPLIASLSVSFNPSVCLFWSSLSVSCDPHCLSLLILLSVSCDPAVCLFWSSLFVSCDPQCLSLSILLSVSFDFWSLSLSLLILPSVSFHECWLLSFSSDPCCLP